MSINSTFVELFSSEKERRQKEFKKALQRTFENRNKKLLSDARSLQKRDQRVNFFLVKTLILRLHAVSNSFFSRGRVVSRGSRFYTFTSSSFSKITKVKIDHLPLKNGDRKWFGVSTVYHETCPHEPLRQADEQAL